MRFIQERELEMFRITCCSPKLANASWDLTETSQSHQAVVFPLHSLVAPKLQELTVCETLLLGPLGLTVCAFPLLSGARARAGTKTTHRKESSRQGTQEIPQRNVLMQADGLPHSEKLPICSPWRSLGIWFQGIHGPSSSLYSCVHFGLSLGCL